MKVLSPRFLSALLGIVVAGIASSASATVYPGNGGTGFGGDVGNGSLSVTNDGTGGLDFIFTLNGTNNIDPNNALVIYIDNSGGNGIGADTSGMTDSSNGAAQAISEYNGTNRSILNFGGLMNPQYGISLTSNNALDYKLVNGGSLTFTDNADAGTTSGSGESYSISGDVWSLDLPAVDFGLSSFSGDTVKFVAIEVSQTGYSSNEATVSLTGTQGYGSTQTMGSVNSFTMASVPEPSTFGFLACGAGFLLLWKRHSRLGRSL